MKGMFTHPQSTVLDYLMESERLVSFLQFENSSATSFAPLSLILFDLFDHPVGECAKKEEIKSVLLLFLKDLFYVTLF